MRVVTFYSFKGGVGRTLALSNVATSLCLSGKKVLIVDFDLEAPGIDTQYFPNVTDTQRAVGLAGYIHDYIENAKPSKFSDKYFYKVNSLPNEQIPLSDCPEFGELCVMPAGTLINGLGIDMAHFDWEKFYSEQEGYLLFEFLRNEWELMEFEYVLIDSRTGLSDVSGICTRQLPNTVCLLYMLDNQNLEGIKQIKTLIDQEQSNQRKENGGNDGRLDDIIYVESNIPFLDDDEEVLQNRSARFSEALSVYNPDDDLYRVERYHSLQLIESPLFTFRRPRSRIARQFTKLRSRIALKNNLDREVLIARLISETKATEDVPTWFDLNVNSHSTLEIPYDWNTEFLGEKDLENLSKFALQDEEVLIKLIQYSLTQLNLHGSNFLSKRRTRPGLFESSEDSLIEEIKKLERVEPLFQIDCWNKSEYAGLFSLLKLCFLGLLRRAEFVLDRRLNRNKSMHKTDPSNESSELNNDASQLLLENIRELSRVHESGVTDSYKLAEKNANAFNFINFLNDTTIVRGIIKKIVDPIQLAEFFRREKTFSDLQNSRGDLETAMFSIADIAKGYDNCIVRQSAAKLLSHLLNNHLEEIYKNHKYTNDVINECLGEYDNPACQILLSGGQYKSLMGSLGYNYKTAKQLSNNTNELPEYEWSDELELLITCSWGRWGEVPDNLLFEYTENMEEEETEMFIEPEQYMVWAWCNILRGKDPSIPLLKSTKRLLEENFGAYRKQLARSNKEMMRGSERMSQFLKVQDIFFTMFEPGISSTRDNDINEIDHNGSITYDLTRIIDILHPVHRYLHRQIYSPMRGYNISSGKFLEDILEYASLFIEHAGEGDAIPKNKLHLFEPKYMAENKNVNQIEGTKAKTANA